jgi:hypothetical protein
MKRLLGIVNTVILLCLFTSCTHPKQQEARKGLEASLERLPQSSSFETIQLSQVENSMGSCHYAVADIMLGTSLSAEDALDVYFDELQALEWIPDERQHEHEKILTHGAQERIHISDFPGWYDEVDESYIQAKKDYPTVIFVILTFYVPQRDGC